MARRYAEDTEVPSARTRAEIEALLIKHGATGVAGGWDQQKARIMFEMRARRYVVDLPLPDPTDEAFTKSRHKSAWARQDLSKEAATARYEQAVRQRYRALLLVLRAKLEAVAAGIVTMEMEFLAHTLLPDGRTVGETAAPAIGQAYRSGEVPELLPGRWRG